MIRQRHTLRFSFYVEDVDAAADSAERAQGGIMDGLLSPFWLGSSGNVADFVTETEQAGLTAR